jgi:hypothetical protein
MRSATVALALAALLALACGLTLAAAPGDGGAAGTTAPAASPRGDARAVARRVAAPDAPEDEEADEAESVEAEAEAPDPPEPPRRTLRIVDGDGDPILGVDVWLAVEDGQNVVPQPQQTTDLEGEASFVAVGEANRVAFHDGEVTRTVELRDPTTEVVVRNLPTLLVSAVDARSGNALDPVRFRFRRGWRDAREAWTGGTRPALAVSSGGTASCAVEIDMPAGYGGYRTGGWRGEVALRARTARLVVPLFEAAERTFRAVDRTGVPLRSAIAASAEADAKDPRRLSIPQEVTFVSAPSGADGLVRLTGLPRIPFTRIAVRLSLPSEDESEASLGGTAAPFDPCADPPEEPEVVVLGRGGSYRGPCGGVVG